MSQHSAPHCSSGIIKLLAKHLFYSVYAPASSIWRKLDSLASWKETQWWIDHLPDAMFTSATYASYADWLRNQGLLSALMGVYLNRENPNILDFGCGMGQLAPVAHHFVRNGGKYLGIDIDACSIAACHKTYGDLGNCSFYRAINQNAWYPQADQPQVSRTIDWPVGDSSQDLVTAMSVFTHFQEEEANTYLAKIHAVLATDGLAILTFLVVRDYVNANPTCNFTHALTPGWHTSNPVCPEMAIGVSLEALERLFEGKFTPILHFEGAFTGGRHPSHQDLFVLRKTGPCKQAELVNARMISNAAVV
jgi:SAM-dependent methyltransferase